LNARPRASGVRYSSQTRSELQTDQPFPVISSHQKGIVINPDTSVDIWFGPAAPAGHESNWLQTVSGKGWNTIFRINGALEPWFDKTWKPGEIEQVIYLYVLIQMLFRQEFFKRFRHCFPIGSVKSPMPFLYQFPCCPSRSNRERVGS
jgi:hypothetical protein